VSLLGNSPATLALAALFLPSALAAATGQVASNASLENELRNAEQRVWIAHQEWLVAGTGPGVNRSLDAMDREQGEAQREQLQESARRTLDAAKTIVGELRSRLAGNEASIGAASMLDHRVEARPGNATLSWRPVPGAATYTVEVNVIGRGTDGAWSLARYVTNLDAPQCTFEIGSGPTRWRVWAVEADGLGGPISEWSEL